MSNEIPEGAQWVNPAGCYARRYKADPRYVEYRGDGGKWFVTLLPWSDEELVRQRFKRLSSASEEQPYTRDNLPADAQWVTKRFCNLCVAKWDLNANRLMFRYAAQKEWVPAQPWEHQSLADLEASPVWERIEREPRMEVVEAPPGRLVRPEGPYGIPLSDKQGIKDFVPPPLPEPKPEPKPRVSTLNRAWRWLAG